MSHTVMQQAFEAWYCADAARQGFDLSKGIEDLRERDGYGDHPILSGKWQGWQAALEQPAEATGLPPLPEPLGATDVDMGPAGPEYADGARLSGVEDAYSANQMKAYALAAIAQPAAPVAQNGMPRKRRNLLIQYALQRFVTDALDKADHAAQDKAGRFFPPGAA